MFKRRLLSALLISSLAMNGIPIALATDIAGVVSPVQSVVAAASNSTGFNVTLMQQPNGTASCSSTTATAGSTITVKVTPSGGYSSGGLAVADTKNNTINVTRAC